MLSLPTNLLWDIRHFFHRNRDYQKQLQESTSTQNTAQTINPDFKLLEKLLRPLVPMYHVQCIFQYTLIIIVLPFISLTKTQQTSFNESNRKRWGTRLIYTKSLTCCQARLKRRLLPKRYKCINFKTPAKFFTNADWKQIHSTDSQQNAMNR